MALSFMGKKVKRNMQEEWHIKLRSTVGLLLQELHLNKNPEGILECIQERLAIPQELMVTRGHIQTAYTTSIVFAPMEVM